MILKTNLLDKGFLELTGTLPQLPPELITSYQYEENQLSLRHRNPSFSNIDAHVVAAARTSYSSKGKGIDADVKLLKYLASHKHTSPFEQVQLQFEIKAPLVVWWQWVRHRTQSLNLQSGRYVAFEEDEFYMPDEVRKQSATGKQMSDGVVDSVTEKYFLDNLDQHYKDSFRLYKESIDNGVAKELARLFLPAFAVYYKGVTSMNLHNLIHFINLRKTPEAQYEIRVYAEAAAQMIKLIAPTTYEVFLK